MRGIFVDSNVYPHEFAQRLGGAANLQICHLSRPREAIAEIAKLGWDWLIIDVRWFGEPSIGMSLLKKALRIVPRKKRIIVYSLMRRDEFQTLCELYGIDNQSIDFFSKCVLEVPPPLEPLRRLIKRYPYMVDGEYIFPMPRRVTVSWIQKQQSASHGLAQFARKKIDTGGTPQIYRDTVLVDALIAAIDSGGLRNVFESMSPAEIQDSTSALERVGQLDAKAVILNVGNRGGALAAIRTETRRSTEGDAPPSRQLRLRARRTDGLAAIAHKRDACATSRLIHPANSG